MHFKVEVRIFSTFLRSELHAGKVLVFKQNCGNMYNIITGRIACSGASTCMDRKKKGACSYGKQKNNQIYTMALTLLKVYSHKHITTLLDK